MQGGKRLDAVLEASDQPQGRQAAHRLGGERNFGARLARILAPKPSVAVSGIPQVSRELMQRMNTFRLVSR